MGFANWNLLPLILKQLPGTPFEYRIHEDTKINEFGQAEGGYGEWKKGYGIVQPASEGNEHVEGVDITRKSVNVWIYGVRLTGTYRQDSSDQIRYLGKVYNVVSVDDWDAYDSYCKCTCQEVRDM